MIWIIIEMLFPALLIITAHVIVQEQPVFYGKVLPQNGG